MVQELAQANALRPRPMLAAFEQQPARPREERLAPVLSERADFGAADLIVRVAQVLAM